MLGTQQGCGGLCLQASPSMSELWQSASQACSLLVHCSQRYGSNILLVFYLKAIGDSLHNNLPVHRHSLQFPSQCSYLGSLTFISWNRLSPFSVPSLGLVCSYSILFASSSRLCLVISSVKSFLTFRCPLGSGMALAGCLSCISRLNGSIVS